MASTVRRLLSCSLLALVGSMLFAQAAPLDAVVDMNLTLEELSNQLARGQVSAPDGRYVVLDGRVTNVLFQNPDPAAFDVVVELVKGEWDGLEEVSSYKGFVLFQGPQFADLFPTTARDATADQIVNNARAIIIAQPIQPVPDPAHPDQVYWLFVGAYIRRIV